MKVSAIPQVDDLGFSRQFEQLRVRFAEGDVRHFKILYADSRILKLADEIDAERRRKPILPPFPLPPPKPQEFTPVPLSDEFARMEALPPGSFPTACQLLIPLVDAPRDS